MKKVLTILFLFCTYLSYSQLKVGADGSGHPVGAFPFALSNEIKGSIKRVKSLVERNALPVNIRDTGMLAWVTDSSTFYVLSGGTANVRWVDWRDMISASHGGTLTVETDPIFDSSAAATVTYEKIAYWNLVGLMMRVDSARKEMHDTAVAHDRTPITYSNDFIVRNDSLFAVAAGEPLYTGSVWPDLQDRPPYWDAKVDQSALDDTAAALRALYQKHDTIYFKHNGFSGFGEKLDPIVNLGFIGFVKLSDSITVRFYRGDSTFLDLPVTIGNGTGSGVSRFSFVNANGISGTVATATTTPTLTLAIDTTKFVTVSRFLDSLSHIVSGGGGGSGSVTSVSVVTANGVSGTVANPTTTPAITLAIDTTKFLTVNNFKDSLTSIHNSITNINNVVDSSHLDSLIKGNLVFGDTHQNITPKADNSNAYEAIDPVVEGAFVTNALELADAKTRYTSQASIFNNWRRFSHGVNTSGAGNPVPSNIIPGTPSETQSWSYNSGTNTISSTLNTASFVGFISPDKYSNYTHTVTLTGHTGATFDDNDYIAVVIAYVEDASDIVTNNAYGLSAGSYPGINVTSPTIPNQHTISLIRGRTSLTNFPFPVSFRYAIVYDLGKTDEQILVNGESSGVWNTDNAYGSGRNCDVRVVRSGDLITTTTTDWDDAPSGKGSLRFPLTFDLSSNPLTQRFRGSASIGYGALSQENATWTNISMNPNTNTIYVLPSGDKYTADITGTYSLDATGSYYNDYGVRRILHNPVTGRTFYVKPDRTIDTIANKAIGTDTASLSNRINTKVNISDTATMQANELRNGSIAWPGVIFATPTTGTVSSHTITLSPTLANQSPYTVFGRASGTGTPSFIGSLDSNFIPGLHTQAYYNTKYQAIGGGGSAGTLQAVLTAGSTLTQANTITNNNYLRFTGASTRIDTAVLGTGSPKDGGIATIRQSGTGAKLITIPTIQGDTATGTRPYGNFYHTIDESYINGDGQRDAVYMWGYNQNGGGINQNTNEAEFHMALESHYQAFFGAAPQFEYHLQSTAKNGAINRHFSMTVMKNDGAANAYWSLDNFDFRKTNASAQTYFSSGSNGITDIIGTSARLTVKNSTTGNNFVGWGTFTPGTDGSFTLQNTGRGAIRFVNSGNNGYDFSDSAITIIHSDRFNTNIAGNTTFLNNSTNGKITIATSTSPYIDLIGSEGRKMYIGNGSTGVVKMDFANSNNLYITNASIVIGSTSLTSSSLFDVNTTTKGAIPAPRMTKAQRDAIASPTQGLQVFVTDNGGYMSFYNSGWQKVSSIADP